MSSTIELSNTIIMPLKNVDNNAVAGAVTQHIGTQLLQNCGLCRSRCMFYQATHSSRNALVKKRKNSFTFFAVGFIFDGMKLHLTHEIGFSAIGMYQNVVRHL